MSQSSGGIDRFGPGGAIACPSDVTPGWRRGSGALAGAAVAGASMAADGGASNGPFRPQPAKASAAASAANTTRRLMGRQVDNKGSLT